MFLRCFIFCIVFKMLWCFLMSQQVYEVVPCQSDCGQYVWVAEPWSVWKVSNVDLKENCGEGVQTRKVRYDVKILSFCILILSKTKFCIDYLLIINLSNISLKVYAEYNWWSFGSSGRLFVWPRGDASWSQREQAAVPRGLCSVRLEYLEPMPFGETINC